MEIKNSFCLQLPSSLAKSDFSWDNSDIVEAKMHSIHQYPAKFPSFIASKSLEYAKKQGVCVKTIGDIFCGCGTTALESELHGIDFLGYDISPVAVMIAKAKSSFYSDSKLVNLFRRIKGRYLRDSNNEPNELDNERIVYWFERNQIIKLASIKRAIDSETLEKSKYRNAFYCIFSSILKPCSKWLAKSIKPQIDPKKSQGDCFSLFEKQFFHFRKAALEIKEQMQKSKITRPKIQIKKENILSTKPRSKMDLIISSPPYVTSYEYADLHQLSSLWLGYANDYRELRKGTIGSSYGCTGDEFQKFKVNDVGKRIISELEAKKIEPAKIRSVMRYYSDMETASKRCYNLLNDGGMALFVIGDTEFKGVKISNCDHLYVSMIDAGFSNFAFWKRRICGKTLSPFRDDAGRFTNNKKNREIYHEEYIICGRKILNG